MLYHGSKYNIREDYLEVKPTAIMNYEPKVFATPSLTFALQYTGRKWTNKDFEAGRINDGDLVMIEKRPGVFKKTFSGIGGWLYTVDVATFEPDSRLMSGSLEVVSDVPVLIKSKTYIPDAAKALLDSGLIVIPFSELNLIKFVKTRPDVTIDDQPITDEHLQVFVGMNKKTLRVNAAEIDYESLNKFLYGVEGDLTSILQIGYTPRQGCEMYFVRWEGGRGRQAC
jgi:hypothetical protein